MLSLLIFNLIVISIHRIMLAQGILWSTYVYSLTFVVKMWSVHISCELSIEIGPV